MSERAFESFVRDTLTEIKEGQGRVEHAIFGNGSPGLKTDVALLRSEVDVLNAAEAQRREDNRWFKRAWVGPAVGYVAVALATGCVGYVSHKVGMSDGKQEAKQVHEGKP